MNNLFTVRRQHEEIMKIFYVEHNFDELLVDNTLLDIMKILYRKHEELVRNHEDSLYRKHEETMKILYLKHEKNC